MKHRSRLQDIAELAGVSRATVDRVLHNRPGVKRTTITRIHEVLEELKRRENLPDGKKREKLNLNFSLVVQSGPGFNKRIYDTIDTVIPRFRRFHTDVRKFVITGLESGRIAEEIQENGAGSDGIILVCQEHPLISDAVNRLADQGVPIVTITTDLPGVRHLGCVQMDQVKAGQTAAMLLGRFVGDRSGGVLLFVAGSFRCQKEREMGFRQTLREKFPHLDITEIIPTEDSSESSYANMKKALLSGAKPLAAYNVSGGTKGIADAIREIDGPDSSIVYISHELTANARELLLRGQLDAIIDHDVGDEIDQALKHLINYHMPNTFDVDFTPCPVRIYLPANVY